MKALLSLIEQKKGKYKGKSQIDVDLYNPWSSVGNFIRHQWKEVRFNRKHKRGTHPGDVIFQLEKRGVKTGVSCKRK